MPGRELIRAVAGLGAALPLTLSVLLPLTAAHAQGEPPPSAGPAPLPAAVQSLMDAPQYRNARWGLFVADRATGAPLYDLNGGALILPASTTKLFSTAAALDAYGADFRFETPVYRRGTVDGQGALQGDLVLVASGDLTMGGRDTADGRIDFTYIDHAEANVIPGSTLTPQDPLAGLNDLASQVAASGVRRVGGDVVVDARLFPQRPKDDYLLSPIMINDNLIDVTVTPGAAGAAAAVTSRPQSAAYRLNASVQTVAAGQPLEVTVTAPAPGVIEVKGQVPAGNDPVVRTSEVTAPADFARTLFIEALQRQGVTVAATPTGANPEGKLPAAGSYAAGDRVAVHRSLPFSENIKLILKVSMNRQADTLINLLAVKHGQRTFEEGMALLLPFVQKAGIQPDDVSLSDGRGNEYTDLFSPRTVSQLLRYMATRPDFPVYLDAQPVLGVDGTEARSISQDSPMRGKAAAKSGTTVAGDLLHNRLLLMTRGSAGYMTTRSGREVVYALYVMYVPLNQVEDLFPIAGDLGTIAELIYDAS